MSASAAHYLAQLQQLLPPGKALTRELGTNLTDLLAGCAAEFARVDARSDDLADEQFTDTMDETLSDWERVFGLPDCSAPQSTAGRRSAILARIIGVSAQDEAFYIAFADALYTVAFGETFGTTRCARRPYEPFGPGSLTGESLTNMGRHNGASLSAPVVGPGWPYVWFLDVVHGINEVTTLELSDEVDKILECQVGQINQDHAIVQHLYRLFDSADAALIHTHAAALNLFHPVTAAELDEIAINVLPSILINGIEYLWAYDDSSDPVVLEYTSPSGDPPDQMVTRGWSVNLIPSFDSDDADDHSVFTFGDTNIGRLELVPAGNDQMRFKLWHTHTVDSITAYTLAAQSGPITFNASYRLQVVCDALTGELSVYSVESGGLIDSNDDGFLWSFEAASGALHIGKDS